MAGRLDGTAAGRPFSLLADGRDLVLVPSAIRTLLGLRMWWQGVGVPLQTLFRTAGVRLFVRVKWLGRFEVLPEPNRLLRLFLPRTS